MGKIYILEDDKNISEIEQFALKNAGYEVSAFATASDFENALTKEHPDLIIMDIMLPDRDGSVSYTHLDVYKRQDEDTLEAAEMVLNSVNKKLVQIVEQLGVRAIGISGKDGRLLTVKKKLSEGQDIGYVGEVTHVNEDILLELLEDDFLPIVCPIGLDEDYHGYNINADDAASAIAEAVKAEKLAFLTDTEGVYMDKDDSSTVISEMTVSEAEKLIEDGIIAGGMLPKIKNCMDAIKNGVSRVHILDGRIPHSILLEIFTNKGVGTAILDDEQEKFYTDLLNK